jgi:signal transduction histidine kinase/ActR/RegA family two-component response regulator
VLPLGLALLVLAVVLIVSTSEWKDFSHATGAVESTRQVLFHSTEFLSLMKDAETSQRGFLLSHEEAYLNEYKRAIPQIPGHLQALLEMEAGNPTSLRLVARLERTAEEKLAELAKTISLERAGRHDEAISTVRTSQGINLMLEVRQLAGALEDGEFQNLSAYSKESQSHAQHAELLNASSVLILLVLVGAATVMIDQALRRRERLIEELRVEIDKRENLEAKLAQTQKMEAVGRLAGGVAHDFNNMLTVISGYNEMLMDRLRGRSDLLDYTQEIANAAEQAANITGQLLAFSRQQTSKPKILDLNETVTAAGKFLQPIIGEHIEMQVSLEPALARIKADPTHIQQIIMNLAVNARDAMPDGGRLLIETANIELSADHSEEEATGLPSGFCVMLAVSDTGSGLDAATRQRLFEPFFTTKELGHGTGLGLSIVYGIVKQAGGDIRVYSEPGKGATFKLYFPLADPAERNVETAPAPAALTTGTGTILLLEDEAAVRKLVARSLSDAGYRVFSAASPTEALHLAAGLSEPVDLLLTDVVMPQMSGPDLARRLTQQWAGLTVMYMSGYTRGGIVHTGLLEPGIVLLQKPFSRDNLLAQVRAAMASKVGSCG